MWPCSPPARDGVVTAGAPTYLTSATGSFAQIGKDGDKDGKVPVGTLVLLIGYGFYPVKSVIDNVTLELSTDTTEKGTQFAIPTGTGLRFVVGGFNDHLLTAFNSVWTMAGRCKYISVGVNPFAWSLDNSTWIDKATYCADTFRGADRLLLYTALTSLLLAKMRTTESALKMKYTEFQTLAAAEKQSLQWQFDLDTATSVMVPASQITVRR